MLMYEHNFDLKLLEEMIPWEREIYTTLLIQTLNEKVEKLKIRQQQNKVKNAR
jgi:hypothetical protein